MRIKITESQLKYLMEIVTNKEVICDKCGWSWKIEEGGEDPFVCHKCGNDNSNKK